MVNPILLNSKKIRILFQKHSVEKAYVFGSAVSDSFNDESDIDFLIQFKKNINPLKKGELWWSLHDSLRELFNREIDIVTENSLKNPYFIKELDNTKELIYG